MTRSKKLKRVYDKRKKNLANPLARLEELERDLAAALAKYHFTHGVMCEVCRMPGVAIPVTTTEIVLRLDNEKLAFTIATLLGIFAVHGYTVDCEKPMPTTWVCMNCFHEAITKARTAYLLRTTLTKRGH